ncbi:MAG: 4Fe-4S binding protein [Proteobacteria bacterium]|nr:4Fe-4S binding protein [Pseudomonadota bacterium]MBU4385155.1 4Fe-4S binding protein [Pseudomonadota bacterium]MBU4604746.1 4Fe-4S binding protein [Pseudomonadota bacterium]MCG2764762.1 4Fe-4S binding protein [Desulfarculaceae bacterium]
MTPPKKAADAKATETSQQPEQHKVSFYPAWCKRCGNCSSFCPRDALAADQWGYPFLARPDRCTSCGLCEMLCPDFAISLGEPEPGATVSPAARCQRPLQPPSTSPERLAPVPAEDK